MPATILVVEDEPAILELISASLRHAGHAVISAESAEEALRLIGSSLPDLALIDWMLPGVSGIELARRIRIAERTRNLPVIMLTARGEEHDKVAGLEAGADDYMTKPFSTRELISRIKAVLRRSRALSSDKLIEIGKLSLDPKSQRITADNKVIDIGPTEYRLLAFFMSHPERAYTRTQLLDQVWGGNVYIEDRTIDVHIRRLRKLLQPYDCSALIQTVRGTGYRFSSLVE